MSRQSYGSELLDEIVGFVRRFVVMTDAEAYVVALWIVHTHAIDVAETTPYLHITSPTKRAGKSRLLDVLEAVCRKPLRAGGATEAALFRAIADGEPTILFDEVDAVFGAKAREHEDLRALLNNGFRRGTPVLRCVGEGTKQVATRFEVFCCKALAGIGPLPDTIADRCLPIRLQRKGRSEPVERFRLRTTPGEAEVLAINAQGWADEHVGRLEDARPDLPDELDDRAQDVCEPLLAIADLAGGDWPDRARAALIEVRNGSAVADDDMAVQLLGDVRVVFETKAVERISTEWLLAALAADDEAPWRTWHRGTPLSARGLARLLKGFGIHSRTVRLDDGTTPKGFQREQFADAWNRYAPETALVSATSATTKQQSQKQALFYPPQDGRVADTKTAANPHEYSDVADVADRTPKRGPNGDAGGRERPLIGDGCYPLFLAEAGNQGHITEDEFSELYRLHKLVEESRRAT